MLIKNLNVHISFYLVKKNAFAQSTKLQPELSPSDDDDDTA